MVNGGKGKESEGELIAVEFNSTCIYVGLGNLN